MHDSAPSWAALAADAFSEAILALDAAGVRLAAGEMTLRACAAVLGAAADPRAVVAALCDASVTAGEALEALRTRGRSCAFAAVGRDGAVIDVEGRATGAIAWLRLSVRGTARSSLTDLAARLELWTTPLCLVGADATLAWANPAWLEQQATADVALDEALRQAVATAAPRESRRRTRLGDERRVLSTRIEPLALGGAIAWTMDVSAEETAQAALARANDAFELTLAGLSDAVAVFDRSHRLARHNEAFARLWDLDPGWLASRPRQSQWLERVRAGGRAPESADFAAFRTSELRRREELHEPVESLWRLGDGRLLRVRGQPLEDGGMILVFADVTSRLQLESQFNQLVKVQQATLDKLTDAVAVFGADARLKLCNDAFGSFWRLPPSVVAGAPAFDEVVEYCIARVHDLQFWRDLKARIGDPDPALREALAGEVVTGDGRRIAWQSRPLPDGATLVGFSDITDTAALQTALGEREAALEAAERLKREFVGAVSRELRTPLTTVLGYAELLAQRAQGLAPAHLGWVGAISEAAGALARLIDDILAVAEVDAGERRLHMSQVDLHDLIGAARERWAARADQAGVGLTTRIEEAPASIRADRGALGSVLDHLIERALAETPSGGQVTLQASISMGEAAIGVADTGRGIPFDVQARIFERFTGLDGAGAGLGLSLVKGLVELHGGWVFVESEPGRGARFSCHLPEAADLPDPEEA
jgi:signal transduction histidine kinase